MCGCKTEQGLLGVLLASLVAYLPLWSIKGEGDYLMSGRVAIVIAMFIVLRLTKRI